MAGCCGGGRCYCKLVQGDGVTITGTGAADNPFVINATGGGGGGADHFYYAEDYGTILDNGDNTAVIQELIDDAHAAGGGTWVIWRRYTYEGRINIRGGVSVYQLSLPQLEVPEQDEIGLVALGPDAQVMYGQGGSGGSTNDNPGEVRNLFVDGAGVGGDGDALFVCDCANAPLYNLNVRRSANHGIDIGSSQNLTFYNIHSGEHHDGTALLLKSRSLGRQGPGGNKIYGGHVGDSYLPIHVTSNGPEDFFPPHDNIIEGVLFETGRVPEDAVIRCNGVFEAGETVLRSCVATSGAQVVTNEEDCCYLVDNPIFSGFSTTLVLDNCYVGGGAGAVKATDGVKVRQSGAFNELRFYGRTQAANIDHLICMDGINLGAGSDLTGSIEGPVIFTTGGIDYFRTINGGTIAGFVSQRANPLRFVMEANLGNPIQVRRATDVGNRIQIDRDGNIRMGPGTGAIVSSILNGPTGLSITGATVVQVATYTTGTRPAPASFTNRMILDTTLGILIWSDGVIWRKTSDGTAA